MAFDFAEAKAQAREVVHDTLAVAATYSDSVIAAAMQDPADVRVRWHTKHTLVGDIENMGYAQIVEGIDRIVFARADATALSVRKGGTITIPQYNDAAFKLDLRLPYDGPYSESWQVTRV